MEMDDYTDIANRSLYGELVTSRPETENRNIFRLRCYTQRLKPKYCKVWVRYLLPYYRDITAIWEIGFDTCVSHTAIFIRILSVLDVHKTYKNTEIYTGTVRNTFFIFYVQ